MSKKKKSVKNEELENELEALKAIYMDDLEILTGEGSAVIEIRLSIVPFPGSQEDNHSMCYLKAKFPMSYPHDIPTLTIEKGKGLSDENVKELQSLVEARANCLTEQVMIFELSQFISEYLQKHNQKPMSFYEQMIMRQTAEKEKEIQNKIKQEKEIKPENALERLINQELEKQNQWTVDEDFTDDTSESFDHSYSTDFPESVVATSLKSPDYTNGSQTVTHSSHHTTDPYRFPLRYKKRVELGRNSWGTVFEVLGIDTNERMMLKEIIIENSSDEKRDKMNELMSDIEKMKKFKHSTIVRYLGCEREVTENSVIFRIFQEFFTEGNVSTILTNYGPLEEGMVRKYARQILLGLKYLHSHSVAHGDLKVSTLLLDNLGNMKLTDYGIAKKIFELLDNTTTVKNIDYWTTSTADILMEENLENQKKKDVYTLGLTLLEMLGGNTKKKSLPENISKDAREFLQCCLRKNEKDRPDVNSLLQHSYVVDISATIHTFIPLSPPITPPPSSPLGAQGRHGHDQSNVSSEIASSGETFGITTSPHTLSRYRNDFDELEELGSGGFGVVVKARNKLDGRFYAIKKVKLDPQQQSLAKMVREVTTLSRLNHQYVVRYYQAWLEGVDDEFDQESDSENEDDWFGSTVSRSQSQVPDQSVAEETNEVLRNGKNDSDDDIVFEYDDDDESPQPPPRSEKKVMLYIQMEYCTKNTMRNVIEKGFADEEERWKCLRQIVEGLNHIHSQGIIHRDLKPSNVFLDSKGDVKIGDFGLATTGTQKVALSSASESDDVQSTRPGIGTPIYCSPEQETVGLHYDHKVDMYSLGIIFFEMCCKFTTGMERITSINALKKEGRFPNLFETQHPNETELIKLLLKRDPNQRPTTTQLLQSNLLPSKMEEEILKEALGTITNPSTTIFSNLMEKLFSIQPDKHLDYTYDYQLTSNFAAHDLIVRDDVFDISTNVCKRHGAILVETPLLIPKNNVLHHNNIATLLDDSGILLTLPYDLTLPFARYIARNKITNLRRYNFSRVYRKYGMGGKPRELYELDFDIVSPQSSSSQINMVNEAEVLKVVSEVFYHYSNELGPFYIRINHCKLLDAILTLCGVSPQHFSHVKTTMNQMPKYNWAQLGRQLVNQNYLNQSSADSLGLYFTNLRQIFDMENALNKLEPLIKKSKNAREAFIELKYLTRHLKTFNILDKCRLDLSFVFNSFYHEGIIYQAILNNDSSNIDIMAAGGRYDKLIHEFLPPNSPFNCSAVGVNIAIEKIISSVLAAEQKRIKQVGGKLRTSDTEVFVCSIGRNMLEDRMQIADELWEHDIKVEFMHSEKLTLEDLTLQCRLVGIPWMVILKDRVYRTDNTVKVKSVDKRIEVDIPRDDLADYMYRVIKYKEAPQPPAPTPSSSHSHEPSTLATQSLLEVQILNQESSNAKLKKKILQMASNKLTPALKKFVGQSTAKVAALDLPFHIIQELCAVYDPNQEAIPLLDKYPRYRDRLLQLGAFLQKHKQSPFVILYCYKDDNFEFLVLV